VRFQRQLYEASRLWTGAEATVASPLPVDSARVQPPVREYPARFIAAFGIPALSHDVEALNASLSRLVGPTRAAGSHVLVALDAISLPMASLAQHFGVSLFESGCVETPALVCKSTTLIRRLVATVPGADWYVRLSLDCFLRHEHLVNALLQWNASYRIYAGSVHRMTTARSQIGHIVPLHLRPIPHAGGGPLYVLSRTLAQRFAYNRRNYYDPAKGEAASISDDVGLGLFFTLVADTHATDILGVLQEPTFSSNAPPTKTQRLWHNTTVHSCPCPIPTPVHHWSRGAMKVAPFIPFEWSSMVALHAKHDTWYIWEALERQDWQLKATNERLLVYLTTDVDGSSWYVPSMLDVCRLNMSQRLSTWHGTCPPPEHPRTKHAHAQQ